MGNSWKSEFQDPVKAWFAKATGVSEPDPAAYEAFKQTHPDIDIWAADPDTYWRELQNVEKDIAGVKPVIGMSDEEAALREKVHSLEANFEYHYDRLRAEGDAKGMIELSKKWEQQMVGMPGLVDHPALLPFVEKSIAARKGMQRVATERVAVQEADSVLRVMERKFGEAKDDAERAKVAADGYAEAMGVLDGYGVPRPQTREDMNQYLSSAQVPAQMWSKTVQDGQSWGWAKMAAAKQEIMDRYQTTIRESGNVFDFNRQKEIIQMATDRKNKELADAGISESPYDPLAQAFEPQLDPADPYIQKAMAQLGPTQRQDRSAIQVVAERLRAYDEGTAGPGMAPPRTPAAPAIAQQDGQAGDPEARRREISSILTPLRSLQVDPRGAETLAQLAQAYEQTGSRSDRDGLESMAAALTNRGKRNGSGGPVAQITDLLGSLR